MAPIFYDTHAHLDYPDFDEELAEVIDRAQGAGITKIISIGTDLASSTKAVQISEQFANVYAVVGWHPSCAGDAPADLRPALREMGKKPKVVALGETGLDYHRLPSKNQKPDAENSTQNLINAQENGEQQDRLYKAKQAEAFAQHLEVASELGLN